jgi:hypothetical protein
MLHLHLSKIKYCDKKKANLVKHIHYLRLFTPIATDSLLSNYSLIIIQKIISKVFFL